MGQFFNFESRVISDWWERRAFLRGWWQKNARDGRWVPPLYAPLRRALVRRAEPSLQRFSPLLLEMNAVERPAVQGLRQASLGWGSAPFAAGEVRVGQVALLLDAETGTAHIALFEVANDDECLEMLLGAALDAAMEAGCARLLITASLLPAFPAGVLVDHFNREPPLHSSYNAPFLADLLGDLCEPVLFRRLWHKTVSTDDQQLNDSRRQSEIQIAAEPSERLAGELLPLVIELWESLPGTAPGLRPPDSLELEFLLRLWSAAPLTLLVARREGQPLGFLLLQPDVGRHLRRWRGGSVWWGALALALRPPRRATVGRILLGGVQPASQGAGIGSSLWAAAQQVAIAEGWRSLVVGPLDEGSPVEKFLAHRGATPMQRYVVYAFGT